MGRRDAVQTILEVVAECRRLLPGLIVTWEPGWETRGNGTSANYSFGSIHHTASASSAARPFPTQRLLVGGRSDLPGPLANVGTPWCTVEAPRLHVVAAHPANHGGASRASGPVPKLALFNPTSLGNEIDYAGTGPMSAGQLLVGHVWTKAVANVLARGNVEVVRGHYETSVTGKWDPGYSNGKSYDMNDWRRKSAAIQAPAPVTPPPSKLPPLASQEDPAMLVQIAPGETAKLPTYPGPTAWQFNVVTGSEKGQSVYGKQVTVGGHAVGLFYGLWSGAEEWQKYIGENQNVGNRCRDGLAFLEVTNTGDQPIAVVLTPTT